jgi:hypothetical protein
VAPSGKGVAEDRGLPGAFQEVFLMRLRCLQLSVVALFAAAAVSFRAPLAAQSLPSQGFALENGDSNGDGGRDISDAVHILSFLYLGGAEPVPVADCVGAPPAPLNGDSNGDGGRDVSDAVHLLNWLFASGPQPADACGLALGEGADRDGRRGRIVPVQARPFGESYEHWAIEFWRWVFSIPAADSPFLTTNCTQPQDGKVWFIGASFSAGTVSCEIPVGKAIFFPVSGFINDYPCPDPNFQPAPGQSLEDFLIETVAPFVAMIEEVEIFIDGVSAGSMLGQRVTSGLFTFTGDTSLQQIDPCITGTPQPAIVDGYYVMVVGLGPGEHSLRVRMNFAGTIFEVTNLVTIVGP